MRKRKGLQKLISSILTAAALLVLFSSDVRADALPYQCYNYNYWEDIVYTPAPYEPDYVVDGLSLTYEGEPIGNFVTPQDVTVAKDGTIYLADTRNNRIVIQDASAREVKGIITSFDHDGTEDHFDQPYGVAVSEKDQLYIADSQNRRVVVLNPDGSLARIVQNPMSEILEDGFIFVALKVTVDYADRVYCIAQNMFEGIMVFETDGSFTGFFGTINVNISLWEKFWRKLATKEERAKAQLFIPTEFTGVEIDPERYSCGYYERKAIGGAASVCVGDACPNEFGRARPSQINLWNDDEKQKLSDIAGCITRHGAVASIEILG